MSAVAVHHCPDPEHAPLMVTCGACHRSWCERCDPAPSALCHWCNGRGYSIAPIPPRQHRAIMAKWAARRHPAVSRRR